MGLLWMSGSQAQLQKFNQGTKREFMFKEGPVFLATGLLRILGEGIASPHMTSSCQGDG